MKRDVYEPSKSITKSNRSIIMMMMMRFSEYRTNVVRLEFDYVFVMLFVMFWFDSVGHLLNNERIM